jgi:hypothetical protein
LIPWAERPTGGDYVCASLTFRSQSFIATCACAKNGKNGAHVEAQYKASLGTVSAADMPGGDAGVSVLTSTIYTATFPKRVVPVINSLDFTSHYRDKSCSESSLFRRVRRVRFSGVTYNWQPKPTIITTLVRVRLFLEKQKIWEDTLYQHQVDGYSDRPGFDRVVQSTPKYDVGSDTTWQTRLREVHQVQDAWDATWKPSKGVRGAASDADVATTMKAGAPKVEGDPDVEYATMRWFAAGNLRDALKLQYADCVAELGADSAACKAIKQAENNADAESKAWWPKMQALEDMYSKDIDWKKNLDHATSWLK